MPKKPLYLKPSAAGQKGGGKGGAKGGKGNTKGKGKGKGQNAQTNAGGKGGGRVADLKCLCCGAKGHAKADCHQRDKTCNNCGKAGHLASVCRSAQVLALDDAPQAGDISDEAFAAAAASRGVQYTPPPAAVAVPAVVEHTATTIKIKSQAKDEAAKKLDKLIDRKMLKEKELKKIIEEAEAMAITLHEAEVAYKEELSAAHLALVPKSDPTALNVSAFFDNIHDLGNLKVDFGDAFKCDELSHDDQGVINGMMAGTLKHLAEHLHSQYGPLKKIMDDAKKAVTEMKETAAKKRKGASGEAVSPPDAPAASTAAASCCAASAPAASPASPSPAEKDSVAADKKAADAAAAAETAKLEAEKAKQAALEKEQEARSYKLKHDAEITKLKQGAEIALKTKLPDGPEDEDAEMRKIT